MCSIATIPFLGLKFLGLIACLYHQGTDYRFATYNRGKVQLLKRTENGLDIELQKNKYYLSISAAADKSSKLLAPTKIGMDREIFESLNAEVIVKLFYEDKCVLHRSLKKGGMEMSEVDWINAGK